MGFPVLELRRPDIQLGKCAGPSDRGGNVPMCHNTNLPEPEFGLPLWEREEVGKIFYETVRTSSSNESNLASKRSRRQPERTRDLVVLAASAGVTGYARHFNPICSSCVLGLFLERGPGGGRRLRNRVVDDGLFALYAGTGGEEMRDKAAKYISEFHPAGCARPVERT